jgi:hypothetical protein
MSKTTKGEQHGSLVHKRFKALVPSPKGYESDHRSCL